LGDSFSYFEGKILKEVPVSYSMFVRAWYNEDTYADFKTNGLLVLSTPLAKRKIKGAAVSILLWHVVYGLMWNADTLKSSLGRNLRELFSDK
jgi:hypothetical protein